MSTSEYSIWDNLPATTVAAMGLLATANCTIQALTKALAHLGCSCHAKNASIDPDDHERFCRFRMKMEDLT